MERYRKLIWDQRGTITIYLVIIFLALVIFLGLFVDLARIKIAQNQLRRVANAAARSVLADYNTDLKDKYGLFVLKRPEYQQDFHQYAATNLTVSAGTNFNLLDYRLEDSNLIFAQPLSDPEVLKQQILDDMKYTAPIEITKGLINKLKPLAELVGAYQGQKKQSESQEAVNAKFQEIRTLNRENAQIEQELQKLKRGSPPNKTISQAQTVAQLEATLQAKQDQVKRLRAEIQQQMPEFTEEPEQQTVKAGQLANQRRCQAKFGYSNLLASLLGNQVQDFSDGKTNDQLALNNAQQVGEIVQVIQQENKLASYRNEIYINEYALTYFTNLAQDPPAGKQATSAEVEYILYGAGQGLMSPQARAVQQLYGTRFALDSLAYFAFSKVAPPDFIARSIYALMMGAGQATADTYQLLADPNQSVLVAEMQPRSANPLATTQLELNYQEHLRLFMLLDALQLTEAEKKAKLTRIGELIGQKDKLDSAQAFTLLDGNLQVSIKLWFFPLSGISQLEQGPFGTEIKAGRAYLTKSVELGY